MDWEVARKYLIPAGIVLFWLALGGAFQILVSVILHKAARKTQTEWDDIIIDSLKGVVFIWFLLAGVEIALKTVAIPPKAARPLDKGISILAIISVVVFLVRLARRLVSHYFDKQIAVPASIIRTVSSVVIYVIGFLVILDLMGLSITPMLTALGVGGLAVALGLQNTLSVLFAGLHILMAKQIRRGDFIKLENGDEGRVTDITWRNVTIHTLSNNLVIVPNDKLASSIVTNFHLPEAEISVLVEARVPYGTDLKRAEAIITEVGSGIMNETPGGIPGFQPLVRYNILGDSGMGLTVILRGRQYADQYLIKHEFLKKLHERFRAEGIEIPPPARRVLLEGEKDGSAPATEKEKQ